MNDIKISDKLLSWVLRNERQIEFLEIKEYKGYSRPTYLNLHYLIDGFDCEIIPLDFFIHLAKIKAFECGYELECDSESTAVYYNEFKNLETFAGEELIYYDIITELKALEWVAEKVAKELK